MSVTRKERVARQQHRTALACDRISQVFDTYRGGVSKSHLVALAEVPEESVGALMVALRKQALDIGHIPMVLKIGGEWIYGWADSLQQHQSEHHKRRKNEARSLALSIEMYSQSLVEHPDNEHLKYQLRSATHRLEDVEAQLEVLTGQLRLIKQEIERA